MIRKKSVYISCLMMAVLFISFLDTKAYAYVKNGTQFTKPKELFYYIDDSVRSKNFDRYVEDGIREWNKIPQVRFIGEMRQPGLAQLTFTRENEDNGTYAIAYRYNHDYKNITFYKLYDGLSTNDKRETSVHEIGHSLGLAHCEKEKNEISVMRQFGFNDKPYPLSDDKAGIASIYK